MDTWKWVAVEPMLTSARLSIVLPARPERQTCQPRAVARAGSCGSTSQTQPNSRSIGVPSGDTNALATDIVMRARPVSWSFDKIQVEPGTAADGGLTSTVDGSNEGRLALPSGGTSGGNIREAGHEGHDGCGRGHGEAHMGPPEDRQRVCQKG